MTAKPVILYCADNASSTLEGRKMSLEENGYQVLTVANGKEAMQAFVSNTIDLVLLDCDTPQEDGGVAAMHMKACKPDVPIALLSGDEWLPPSAGEAVDAFISKSEPMTRGFVGGRGWSSAKALGARLNRVGIVLKNKGIVKAPVFNKGGAESRPDSGRC